MVASLGVWFSFDQHSGKDYFNQKKDAETAEKQYW